MTCWEQVFASNCRKHGDLQRMSDVPLWHVLQTFVYYSLPCNRVCVRECVWVCVSVSVRAWGYVYVYVSVRVWVCVSV